MTVPSWIHEIMAKIQPHNAYKFDALKFGGC